MPKIDKSLIALADGVPDIDVPFAEIRSPKWEMPVRGWIICPKMLPVWTHYYGGRTIPHLTDRTQCEGCKAERGKRWKGYLGMYNLSTKEYMLGELTPFAAMQWRGIFEDDTCNLRGAYAEIVRLARSPQSRCKLTLNLKIRENNELPEPFNMLDVLYKIWSGSAQGRSRGGMSIEKAEMLPR